jgi:saccharopine dehydrogenase-like NADP-dependent oxidoreductase
MTAKILILGGYGNTGKLIAEYLLPECDANITIAGRDASKAETLARQLDEKYPGRVTGLRLDAGDAPALGDALNGIHLLVAASSTSQYAEATARACLAAGVDYLDVQYSSAKVKVLQSLQDEITRAGRTFITDAGFHPGLPAALVRYAVLKFDRLFKANVGSVIKVDWNALSFSPATIAEMVGEFSDFDSLFFKDGAWKRGRMDIVMDYVRMDFGAPFGRQVCMPMMLEEMRALPQSFPTLREMGFFVGGFNPVTDWVVMPLMMVGLKIMPRASKPVERLLVWSLQKFSRPPYGTRLKLEAEGEKDGQHATFEMLLSHADGYVFTAVPVVATVLQWLDGSIRKPGLFTQGELAQPERLLSDMKHMGITVKQG